MTGRKWLVLISVGALACIALWAPVRKEAFASMKLTDAGGQAHELRLVRKWPLIPLNPYLVLEIGNESWLVHSGHTGYADTASVYVSPDRREGVVACQFEGGRVVFVKLDLATETGTSVEDYPSSYLEKGWVAVDWNFAK